MKSIKLEQFFKRNWPYLIVLLVIIVGIQTGCLIWMHRQINDSGNVRRRISISDTFDPQALHQGTLSLFSDDPLKDHFFNSPFDANSWNPLQEMQTMQDRINSMFGDAFGRFSQSPDFRSIFESQSFTPNIDIRDEDDRFVIKIDLPGANSSNVDVTCEDRQLKISGSTDQFNEEHQDGTLLRRERRSGHFSRSIPLSAPVESDKMETKFDKGVMTVKIPKAE